MLRKGDFLVFVRIKKFLKDNENESSSVEEVARNLGLTVGRIKTIVDKYRESERITRIGGESIILTVIEGKETFILRKDPSNEIGF